MSYKVEIKGQEYEIRDEMLESLRNYINSGCPVRDFLQAVLMNNLVEAMGRADLENFLNLPTFAHFLYWEAPSFCWGNEQKMKDWIAHSGLKGAQKC